MISEFLSIVIIFSITVTLNGSNSGDNIMLSQEITEPQLSDEEELPNPISPGVVAVFPGFIIHGL